MFILKKLITSFLLPPGIFVALLFGCGAWLARRRGWRVAVLPVAIAFLLWGASTPLVSEPLLRGLERGVTIPAEPRGDVIVLLGGGINGTVPDLTGKGAPSEDALARLVTAARLQRRLGLPVIASGGRWSAGHTPEAPIMKRFLVDLGVPGGKVITEEQSRDTAENARYTAGICRERGFAAPLLVTSAYHMRRSRLAFEREGMRVTPVAAGFKTGEPEPLELYDFLPRAASLLKTATALHEYLGLVFYRLSM